MAVVPRTATLRIDDTATHAANVLQWVATANVQDTPAGGSITITTTRTTAGVPPGDPNTLTLALRIDTATTIKTFTLDPTALSQVSTFHFTNDGESTGSPRAGTLEIALRATRTMAPTYDVETDGSPNTPPATFDTHLDRGWVRGTTTATQSVSNVAIGGAKNEPAGYDDSLFVRTNLGSTLYAARALTVGVAGATPVLTGNTNSATTGNFDATFTAVVDNRWPNINPNFRATTLTIPNSALTGLPDFTVTTTADSILIDPRITISVQAQGAAPRVNGANDTQYVISADELRVWARARNSRLEAISGITMTQRLLNGAQVNATDSTAVTGSDGWTPASPGIDFTTSVVAPAGNRTQEAFPAAPADATGLGTGQQTLGFTSAYTADKALAIHLSDEIGPGEETTIKVEYTRSDGVRLVLDSAPNLRIYSLDSSGNQVDDLAVGAMTRIGSSESWSRTWTPTTAGIYIVEVRALSAGGGVEAAQAIKVIPRSVLDPIAVGLHGVVSQR